ncbi:Fis family transcriptional regulator [Verticiella sediminum]|uniref:Putative Fis-like DNA-binding protein n=1 Tax=Verticiella sediminum TaxID=1247510 RepID=A0A556B233_9BURK|nr:helix-turn-helix domain-containing protein [Verticiella sediminum]TSH99229.1 Fis family transcriptional regulator [Verticiella sediminum]
MEKRTTTLEVCVRDQLDRYFRDLDGESTGCIWQMVISAVERPMLEAVLERAGGNQSRAAEMLGINRNTLRKKIDQYGLRADAPPPLPQSKAA